MGAIDEAFLPFHQMMEGMVPLGRGIRDEDAGVYSYIYACEIETPIELDVVRDEQGVLHIGCVPPMYRADTSVRPVFHNLTFTAEIESRAVENPLLCGRGSLTSEVCDGE